VDVIAGSSMGAYVASVWRWAATARRWKKLAREVEGAGTMEIDRSRLPSAQRFIRGEAVIARLRKTLGDAHFSESRRPLRIVATDLNTLDCVVFSKWRSDQSVHASSAIPGVCVPVEMTAKRNIDGGVTEPLPIDVLAEMGVDKIIAVNACPLPRFLRCCRREEKNRRKFSAPSRGAQSRQTAGELFANGNHSRHLYERRAARKSRVASKLDASERRPAADCHRRAMARFQSSRQNTSN